MFTLGGFTQRLRRNLSILRGIPLFLSLVPHGSIELETINRGSWRELAERSGNVFPAVGKWR